MEKEENASLFLSLRSEQKSPLPTNNTSNGFYSLIFLGKLDLLYVFNSVPDLNSEIRAKEIRDYSFFYFLNNRFFTIRLFWN